MSINEITLFALCILLAGIYCSSNAYYQHIQMSKALKNKKMQIPVGRAISIKFLIVFFAATCLENIMTNQIDLTFSNLYNATNRAFTLALIISTVAVVITIFSKQINKNKRMLFLEGGFILILSYFVFAPSISMIYYYITM